MLRFNEAIEVHPDSREDLSTRQSTSRISFSFLRGISDLSKTSLDDDPPLSWRVRWKDRIVRHLGGQNENLHLQLSFCPLRYRDPTLERKYVQHHNKSNFSIKLCIFAFIAVVMTLITLINWVVFYVASAPDNFRRFFFEVVAVNILLYTIIGFISILPRFKEHKELALYIFLVSSYTLYIVLCVINFVWRYKSDPDLSAHKTALYDCLSFSVSMSNQTFYLSLLAFTFIFPTRVRIAWYMVVYACFLRCFYKNLIDFFLLNEDIKFITKAIIDIAEPTFLSLLGIIIRFFREVQERIMFFTQIKQEEKLEKAKGTFRLLRQRSNASAAEEISTILDTLHEFISEHPSLGPAIDMLDSARSLLTGNNIYQLQYERLVQNGVKVDPDDNNTTKSGQSIKSLVYKSLLGSNTLPFAWKRSVMSTQNDCAIQELPSFDTVAGLKDICNFQYETDNVLGGVALSLLEPMCEKMKLNRSILSNYFFSIQQRYLDNPYHNVMHAATVASATGVIARSLGLEQGLYPEFGSLIIAAAGHDVGHPGRNNSYCINTQNCLALLYNDVSVLENFHASLLFNLGSRHLKKDIRQTLGVEESQRQRQLVIELILATDMKHHFEFISEFRLRRGASDFLPRAADLPLLMKLCIKLADLSHVFLDWDSHFEWSCRIQEEFYQQGDDEKEQGLPISPLCDRQAHSDMAKSQLGFLNYVVEPLVMELEAIDIRRALSCLGEDLRRNTERWRIFSESNEYIAIPAETRKISSRGHVRFLKEVVRSLLMSVTKTDNDRDVHSYEGLV